MSPRVELAYIVFLGMLSLLALVGIVVLLSRLSARRLTTLGTLKGLVTTNKTYKLVAGLVVYELYQAFTSGQPVNVRVLAETLIVASLRATLGRLEAKQEATKEVVAEVAGTVAATRLPREPTPRRVDDPLPPSPTIGGDVR